MLIPPDALRVPVGSVPLLAAPATALPTANCAAHESGELRCWGANTSGQLGTGDIKNYGDETLELGTRAPLLDVGGEIAQLATRVETACAVLRDGRLKCWDANQQGQLGLGDFDARGDQPNEMGSNLPAVNLGTGRTARRVAVGRNFVCAILDNGAVKCWGADAALGYAPGHAVGGAAMRYLRLTWALGARSRKLAQGRLLHARCSMTVP